MLKMLRQWMPDSNERQLRKLFRVADQVEELEPQVSKLTDNELRAKTEEFKNRLQESCLDELLPEAFAVVREAGKRVLGMRHFRVQLVGGVALHRGEIAEMRTGEGKTLVSTLPAYLNALSGKGVHVITVNDYLAKRDREWMGQLFEFLGLTVGLNLSGMSPEEKKQAYAADITFGTNNEFGFDYLRDNMALYPEQMAQRIHYAIIDEVDSILIDEARTPLIISGQANKATDLYYAADKMVRRLRAEDDYTLDEKTKAVSLTEEGVDKVESFFGIENVYDAKHITLNHHVQQALKAHVTMKRDSDYVVNEEGVVIVDEFTGRLMTGRRYSDGLHQAIEAKEGLQVQRESMTLATVTLQNYFRMYDKLAGMTGTAKTEEEEFRKIYGMDVVQIPTNKPMVRQDMSDILYKTEEAKFRRVVSEIKEKHRTGQPILVGTVSIERSEILSRMLKKEGITHQVLNAKNHEREAEIISQAGQKNAVTIATNMAGRGTDIVLGEGVDKLGGLHVIGTERHESRRIDNQLRGRSGRQGDPGSSQFFLSFQDELMRRFGSDNLSSMMERLGLEDDQPIEGKFFSKAVANAQKKVEGNNFDARRWVLQYDDVLNQQREIIYKQRRDVILSDDLRDVILLMAKELMERLVDAHIDKEEMPEEWDLTSLLEYVTANFVPAERIDEEHVEQLESATAISAYLYEQLAQYYDERRAQIGEERLHEFSKTITLRTVDRKWMDHIDAMEHLRQGIHLRAYGQINPLREYQFEGFEMFSELVAEIQEEVVKYVLQSEIGEGEELKREQVAVRQTATSGGTDKEEKKKQPLRRNDKIGRNEPCPCGSGKKYKNCCAHS
ncbi:preprotein translocase subunit SecA [Mechercharimyces sp. CAU 1602]|uniref:preprotein translocase subunit SecA n=1 Tax=Mechercharimyces sp. CAU 1602 TaxID=2973933 RepID=UPI002162ACFC|nr:preprotein translocase subunit SecA [Mechercharimyces sp. CAU 1602]MCS1352228.1 preprotein translocase subunit SecA [Mechercharimyces sp. CAU 1602]